MVAFCGIPILFASTHLIRVPNHDSAVIRFDRIGGRFSYSAFEGHAYAAPATIIQNVATPGIFLDTIAAPIVSNNDPTSDYAFESANLPKEHRGLPLNFRFASLSNHQHYN